MLQIFSPSFSAMVFFFNMQKHFISYSQSYQSFIAYRFWGVIRLFLHQEEFTHVFLQFSLWLFLFCYDSVIIYCIVSFNFCNFSGGVQWEPSDSFSAYCLFILNFSLFLPFPLLPLFPRFLPFPPQTLDKGSSKMRQNKDWI